MQPRIMVTNGGSHSPEKWADTTAWKILDLVRPAEGPIPSTVSDEDRQSIEAGRESARQEKNRLEPLLSAAMVAHHAAVQSGERAKIAADGAARLTCDLDCAEHVEIDAVIADVAGIVSKSAFASHFAKDVVMDRVREIVTDNLHHAMANERSLLADKQAA